MIVTIHHEEIEPAQTYGPVNHIDIELDDGQQFTIAVRAHLLSVHADGTMIILPIATNAVLIEGAV